MKFPLLLLPLLLLSSCSPGVNGNVKKYKAVVDAEYPHDTTSYTQGLFFSGDKMYESTGEYGSSTFRLVDIESGNALRRLDFGKEYFVEGSVMLGKQLYILTWTNRKVFVYDALTLEHRATRRYPRQGWGLTTDGRRLVASDGSNRIFFMDKNLKVKKTIKVSLNGTPLRFLNELEWIDGRIWANVYTTDKIVIINPRSGNVEGVIDCAGLLPDSLRTIRTDVLNGIAWDNSSRTLWLTGKNWPRLYRVHLEAIAD